MRLAMAVLCDAVSVREGTLGVLGAGLNILWREKYPAPLMMDLALLLEFGPEEAGIEFDLDVTIFPAEDEERSEPLFEAQGQGSVDGETVTTSYVPLPLQLGAVEIPSAGEYRLRIVVSERIDVEIPFYAHKGTPDSFGS